MGSAPSPQAVANALGGASGLGEIEIFEIDVEIFRRRRVLRREGFQ